MSDTGTLHKECAETVMDAIMIPPRDPGNTILAVLALCRASGAVRKADRAREEPAKADPSKRSHRRKPVTSPAA